MFEKMYKCFQIDLHDPAESRCVRVVGGVRWGSSSLHSIQPRALTCFHDHVSVEGAGPQC